MEDDEGPLLTFRPSDCVSAEDVAAYLNRAEVMLAACPRAVSEALEMHKRAWPRLEFSQWFERRADGPTHWQTLLFPTDRVVLVESVEGPENVKLRVMVKTRLVASGSGRLVCWAPVRPREHLCIEMEPDVKSSDLRVYGYILER